MLEPITADCSDGGTLLIDNIGFESLGRTLKNPIVQRISTSVEMGKPKDRDA
jgi:hypothetical protein